MIEFVQEKLFGQPIPEGGVSYGVVSPSNVSLLALCNNALLSPSYGYQTVTIEFRTIEPGSLPSNPTISNFGNQKFNFRSKEWTLLKVEKGSMFQIGSTPKLYNASVTGIDLNNPIITL